MTFDSAAAVENATYDLLLDGYEAGLNRARVDSLAGGCPPYTQQEEEENNIGTNTNDLSLTNILHNARRQFHNAFLAPDPLFTVNLDYGPVYKKREWGMAITKKINKALKNSQAYFESRRSVFANVCAHGIGPGLWNTKGGWCPYATGVEDVLIPADTYLMMEDLEHFAVYREYSPHRLHKMTSGPKVDSGWQMDVVKAAIAWADKQAGGANSDNWPNLWFPEKQEERLRNGILSTSVAPKIGCFDFYYYDDAGDESGWRRRIILDAWGAPGGPSKPSGSRTIEHGKDKFLYDSGNRVYADKLSKIIHFQFADCSAKAPFTYKGVRSLGFLMYAVCHLQNRLGCKFNDHVFQCLLQYFTVSNPADMDRLTKIDLQDKGILPEGLGFVKKEDRWTIDQALVMGAFQRNRQIMADNSSSFTQDFDFEKENASETATRTMAKINATAALVGAMLNQAYSYQYFQYIEICRRFCEPNSRDADVRKFRVDVLRDGVPEEALDVERWDIQPAKVLGAGNQQLQVAMADKLMAWRPMANPSAQKEVDRIYITANSQDYDLADRMVPEEPEISGSIHDTELVFGALMSGSMVQPRPGLNPVEVVSTMTKLMENKVQEITQTDNLGTPADVKGLSMANAYAEEFLKQLGQDKSSKEIVKQAGDELGKIMNLVKAFHQRQQEAAQEKAQQNGGLDPKDRAKIQLGAQSHAQRTAQRQLQFEQKVKQDEIKNRLELQKGMREHAANLAKVVIETGHAVKINRMKSLEHDAGD